MRPTLVLLALGALALAGCAQAIPQYNITWMYRDYNTQRPNPDLTVPCNSIVKFAWSHPTLRHSLVQTGPTCDPNEEIAVIANRALNATASIYYTHGGTYYYKCGMIPPAVPTIHCESGQMHQKITVEKCTTVPKNVIDWTYRAEGAVYAPIQVRCGVDVFFRWNVTRGVHKVDRLEEGSCGSKVLWSSGNATAAGDVKLRWNKEGTYYYGCDVQFTNPATNITLDHCKDGHMFIQINVIGGTCSNSGRKLLSAPIV